MGSDVFLNCFDLAEVALYARPEAATGLPAIVSNITGNLRAVFQPEGPDGAVCAAFRYPEYWEDIEETPAHILLHTFSGQGYHYRQCFRDGLLLTGEYDAVFAQGHGGDDPVYMALLCFDRLRYPLAAGSKGRGAVPGFPRPAGRGGGGGPDPGPGPGTGCRPCWTSKCWTARRWRQPRGRPSGRGDAQAAALVANAEYQARAAAPKCRRRYDFDF